MATPVWSRFAREPDRRGITLGSALWPLCRYRHKTHWTGHESRLNRDLRFRFEERAYAAEELVAELTAAFLCAEFSIGGDIGTPAIPNPGLAFSSMIAAPFSQPAAGRKPRRTICAGLPCATSLQSRRDQGDTTMAGYEVWEFWGRGDPFFGGNADDRILYEVGAGHYQFLSGPEAARRKVSPAAFEDKVTAFQTGEVCARKEGRIVRCQV
jgi:hypothetical protein